MLFTSLVFLAWWFCSDASLVIGCMSIGIPGVPVKRSTPFNSFKPYWVTDSEWNGCIFNDKLNLVKDKYYNIYYPGDVCNASFTGKIITIFGIDFIYDMESETYKILEKGFSSVDLVCIAHNFYRYFESVNRYGFVTEDSLNGNFISFFKEHLVTLGYEKRFLGNSEITYSIWHNFIFLNIYILLEKYLKSLDGKESFSYDEIDFDKAFECEVFEELVLLKQKYFHRLDQYLKMQLGKRGISVIQNTYCAFDTEYQLLDASKNLNDLISVQAGVQLRTLIKIPLYRNLDISFVNPLSSNISDIFKNKIDNKNSYQYNFSEDLDYKNRKKGKDKDKKKELNEIFILNNSIKSSILSFRNKFFNFNDSFCELLIAKLKDFAKFKECEEMSFFEDFKQDQIVFSFPVSKRHCKILYPEKTFSFLDLVDLSNSLSASLNKESEPLINGLEKLENSNASSVSFPKEHYWCFRGGFFTILAIFNSIENEQGRVKGNYKQILSWFFNDKQNVKSRMRTKILLIQGSLECNISLSVTKNTYLIGHYNAADFSMLNGFDEIKQSLSIVSKSFLTMAKPIKINNTNIHIRDTILLAPGGQKSLAGLGKLYEKEGDFNKRQLTQKEYENMRGVLENDKQLFEDYALQDVIITLKHAIAMEKFNFTVKKLGIPVTLSSIGRNYVTSE